jgi:hypothetical protein
VRRKEMTPGARRRYSIRRACPYRAAMTYTFWHAGILIGSSALDRKFANRGQRGGAFHPTVHGLELFPRLTGILTAGQALKQQLDERGSSAESMEREELEELMETSAAGRKILDLGRMLSEIEVRGPDGSRMEFESIGFSDVLELKRFAGEFSSGSPDLALDLPPGAPRYLVSATFRQNVFKSKAERRARIPWGRH